MKTSPFLFMFLLSVSLVTAVAAQAEQSKSLSTGLAIGADELEKAFRGLADRGAGDASPLKPAAAHRQLAYVRSGQETSDSDLYELRLYDLEDGADQLVCILEDWIDNLTWSGDGRKLVFSRWAEPSNDEDVEGDHVYVVEAKPRSVERSIGRGENPEMLKDGRMIHCLGGDKLWVDDEIRAKYLDSIQDISLSREEQRVILLQNKEGARDSYVALRDLKDGKALIVVTVPLDSGSPHLSPDGNKCLINVMETEMAGCPWIVDLNKKKSSKIPVYCSEAVWDSTSTFLYVESDEKTGGEILRRYDLSKRTSAKVAKLKGGVIDIAYTPNGSP